MYQENQVSAAVDIEFRVNRAHGNAILFAVMVSSLVIMPCFILLFLHYVVNVQMSQLDTVWDCLKCGVTIFVGTIVYCITDFMSSK